MAFEFSHGRTILALARPYATCTVLYNFNVGRFPLSGYLTVFLVITTHYETRLGIRNTSAWGRESIKSPRPGGSSARTPRELLDQ